MENSGLEYIVNLRNGENRKGVHFLNDRGNGERARGVHIGELDFIETAVGSEPY